MKHFKVSVTVTHKLNKDVLWNQVHLSLSGDNKDLLNLQKQLNLVKQDVNQDMNRKNLSLKDVHIKVDFI